MQTPDIKIKRVLSTLEVDQLQIGAAAQPAPGIGGGAGQDRRRCEPQPGGPDHPIHRQVLLPLGALELELVSGDGHHL